MKPIQVHFQLSRPRRKLAVSRDLSKLLKGLKYPCEFFVSNRNFQVIDGCLSFELSWRCKMPTNPYSQFIISFSRVPCLLNFAFCWILFILSCRVNCIERTLVKRKFLVLVFFFCHFFASFVQQYKLIIVQRRR